jgi:thioredoxin 1
MANTTTSAEVIKLTDAKFQEILKENPLLVVDCYADWCAPCRIIAPFIEELSSEYVGRVSFAKVDVDHSPQISQQFGIFSIPTLLFFKNGKLHDQQVGALPKPALKQKVEGLLKG